MYSPFTGPGGAQCGIEDPEYGECQTRPEPADLYEVDIEYVLLMSKV
jgi:hypothetical protein